MNYIMIDVEWYRKKNDPSAHYEDMLVQLAAISMDKQYHEVEKWSMVINPGGLDTIDMTADGVKNIHKSRLEKGHRYDDALQYLSNWVTRSSHLVIWDEKSFLVLRDAFRKARMNAPFVDAILLQDLFVGLYHISDFQMICKRFGIQRKEASFHVAKEEVKCMAEIFRKMMEEQERKGENLSKFLAEHVSVATRQFHNKRKGMNVDAINYLCNKYHFVYHFVAQSLFIKTKFSYWYIETDGQAIRSVYHENHNLGLKNQKSFKQSFHPQKRKFKNLSECLEYIYYHDQYKVERDVRRHYNSDIERLFIQIKKTEDSSEKNCNCSEGAE